MSTVTVTNVLCVPVSRELGGIPVLVRLLDHHIEEVYRAAASCLRNLSYSKERDENKVSVTLCVAWHSVLSETRFDRTFGLRLLSCCIVLCRCAVFCSVMRYFVCMVSYFVKQKSDVTDLFILKEFLVLWILGKFKINSGVNV